MRISLSVPGQRRQFGELLLEMGILSPHELNSALSEQRRTRSRQRLGTLLMERGYITRQQFMQVLSAQMTIVCRFGELIAEPA